MIKKGSTVTNSETSIINNYRKFLNTQGRANEASLVRIYLSFCDITDKAVLSNCDPNPDGDTLIKIVSKNMSLKWNGDQDNHKDEIIEAYQKY